MPFGLKNVPSLFQRLMQLVISDLNPCDGKQFVTAYINNIVVFSCTLEEHLDHLKRVVKEGVCNSVEQTLSLIFRNGHHHN